jgi:hypothetical protein
MYHMKLGRDSGRFLQISCSCQYTVLRRQFLVEHKELSLFHFSPNVFNCATVVSSVILRVCTYIIIGLNVQILHRLKLFREIIAVYSEWTTRNLQTQRLSKIQIYLIFKQTVYTVQQSYDSTNTSKSKRMWRRHIINWSIRWAFSSISFLLNPKDFVS